MKKSFLFFFFFFSVLSLAAQDIIEISGVVAGQESRESLAGVTVSIKGSVTSTVSANDGSFKLRTKQKVPFTLQFSSVGFAPQEIEVATIGSKLQVALATQTVLGSEVVVTASCMPKNILKSPVAIEKLDIPAI